MDVMDKRVIFNYWFLFFCVSYVCNVWFVQSAYCTKYCFGYWIYLFSTNEYMMMMMMRFDCHQL